MSGRKAANIERPTVDQGRALFLQCTARVEPRLLASLGNSVLDIYRRTFRSEEGIDQKRGRLLANRLGWGDDVDFPEDEPPAVRWPEVFWRDPSPNPKLGAKLRRQRVRRKLSIELGVEKSPCGKIEIRLGGGSV